MVPRRGILQVIQAPDIFFKTRGGEMGLQTSQVERVDPLGECFLYGDRVLQPRQFSVELGVLESIAYDTSASFGSSVPACGLVLSGLDAFPP